MAKISISMSDQMEAFVGERVASGDYNNTSEYFRDLVRRDQEKRSAEGRLRAMLQEAEAGGLSGRSVEAAWAEGEARAKRRADAG